LEDESNEAAVEDIEQEPEQKITTRSPGRGRQAKRRKTNEVDESEETPAPRGKSASRKRISRHRKKDNEAVTEEEPEEDAQEAADEKETKKKSAALAKEMTKKIGGKKKQEAEEVDEEEPEAQPVHTKPVEFTGYGDKSFGQKLAESSNFHGKHFLDYFPDQFNQFDWFKIIRNLLDFHKNKSLLQKSELLHLDKWRGAVEEEVHKLLGEGVSHVSMVVGVSNSKQKKSKSADTILFNVRTKDQRLSELKEMLRCIDKLITLHNNSPTEDMRLIQELLERQNEARERKERQEKREAEEFANLKYLNHDPQRQIRYFLERHGIQKGQKQYEEWTASNILKQGVGVAAGRADAIEDDADDLLNETL